MKRVIARLDIKGDRVVRGMHLEGLRVVGKPEEMALDYAQQGIDEIIFIDTVASLYGRNTMLPVIQRTAERVFIPMTVGGGIRSVEDVANLLRSGADKITLNSAAVRRPQLITEISRAFGNQCVVAALEVKREAEGSWTVLIENGRQTTGLDAIEWARQVEAYGAGEILLTSIDQDGTRRGFDLPLIERVTKAVGIPVIATGGAGKPEHLLECFRSTEVDAIALGSLLHFKLSSLQETKRYLAESGIEVRLVTV